jgi:putative glutamine amidotransferase
LHPLIGIPCAGNLCSRTGYRRFAVGQPYCHALHLAGAAPLLVPLLQDEGTLGTILSSLDGLLLAGGGDVNPRHFGQKRATRLSSVDLPRDRVELWLAQQAFARNLPVLAICRGVQLLNVALGGTLAQDIPTQMPAAGRHNFKPGFARNHLGHQVRVAENTSLARIVGAGSLPVNSFHHQCVDRVAPWLQVSAVAEDGIIEGLEAPGRTFVLGVQWHPEELVADDSRQLGLFETFVAAAQESPRLS